MVSGASRSPAHTASTWGQGLELAGIAGSHRICTLGLDLAGIAGLVEWRCMMHALAALTIEQSLTQCTYLPKYRDRVGTHTYLQLA